MRSWKQDQATDEQELLDAISFLRENLRSLTFVDLGCGKVRSLLVAGYRCGVNTGVRGDCQKESSRDANSRRRCGANGRG